MKYAREVIDLLAAYPGHKFRMRYIVNHVARATNSRQPASVRVGVHRVLRMLEDSAQIKSTRSTTPNGASSFYWWEPQKLGGTTRAILPSLE